jgi:hypothetical protein
MFGFRTPDGEIMTSAAPPTSVESTVAGFIVWLARQRSPFNRRHQCPDIVERFLRWQHDQREQGNSYTDDTYCAQMSRCGANEVQVNEARAAIGLFRRYLLISA